MDGIPLVISILFSFQPRHWQKGWLISYCCGPNCQENTVNLSLTLVQFLESSKNREGHTAM
jgi:hypothetical protein